MIQTALLIAGLGVLGQVSSQQNLPTMGEPADSALSPLEEQKLGAEFMRQIRASLPLVRDVQLEEYIQALGDRLALASGKADNTRFTFFIIADESINAFAIPGGYVGVNVGLIAAMDREEQLAGVMAHEVAHVTQRHHARAFATGSRNSLNAAATVLAAILIGQASPEAGQAALAAGLAATQQSVINFTRSNEIEADRIGIEILANASYDPSAMAESFAILRRKNRLNTSAGALEYLRTHPLDNDRIAEAKDRAVGKVTVQAAPQLDFALFTARLSVLTADDPAQLQRAFLASHERKAAAGNAYALALLHHRANRQEKARRYLDELDTFAPAHPMARLLKADILDAAGQGQESRQLLRELQASYPEQYSIVEKLMDQLIRQRKLGEAMRVGNRYLRDTAAAANPRAWRQLASVQQRLGDVAGSHESLARYFEGFNELRRAEGQLELALARVATASQDELRLQASLKVLRDRIQQQ